MTPLFCSEALLTNASSYHWAILIGPKDIHGSARFYPFHVVERNEDTTGPGNRWMFIHTFRDPITIETLNSRGHGSLVALLMIAQVTNERNLRTLLSTSMRFDDEVDEEDRRDYAYVANMVIAVRSDSLLDRNAVRNANPNTPKVREAVVKLAAGDPDDDVEEPEDGMPRVKVFLDKDDESD